MIATTDCCEDLKLIEQLNDIVTTIKSQVAKYGCYKLNILSSIFCFSSFPDSFVLAEYTDQLYTHRKKETILLLTEDFQSLDKDTLLQILHLLKAKN